MSWLTHLLHPWFARPWVLDLLVVIPVLVLVNYLTERRRRRALVHMGSPAALAALLSPPAGLALLRGLCRNFALVLLVVAVAGPQWGRDWDQTTTVGRDLVVVLDLSRSMYARDVLPNRLGRASAAVADLVENTLGLRPGYRVALVLFAARPKIACPLTHDYKHFLETLAAVNFDKPPDDLLPDRDGVSGTRIGAALQEALQAVRQDPDTDPAVRGYRDILLISDGDDPASDSASERHRGIMLAQEQHIPVHVVGVGNPETDAPIPFHYDQDVVTRLREGPLRDIARSTGGTYTPAQQKALSLGSLFRDCIERRPGQDVLPVYRQRYAWFTGGALTLLSLEMLLGRRRRLDAIPPPSSALLALPAKEVA
jgi:Ca-activated chloride channel family protein